MNNKEFVASFKQRLITHIVSLLHFIDILPKNTSYQVIAKQLARSGTSIGANFVEAQACGSKREFVNFIRVALKSANETIFWLTILQELGKIPITQIEPLLRETEEVSKVLGSIAKNTAV